MAEIPNPVLAFTEADLLALIDRLLPPGYLEPLKSPGPGYELWQAYAVLFARASQGVERLGADAQISTALAGALAAGQVELYRAAPPSSGLPITGQAGFTASIVAGAPAGRARVSGLTGMTAASVGRFLVLTNANFSENVGGFQIATYVNPTTVDVVNPVAIIPDPLNGAISWVEESRDVAVKAGTVVTTSKGGRDFATTQDVFFSALDLGPHTVGVQAVTWGYAWNVPGQLTSAGGEVLPGEIDTMKRLVESPEMVDTSIQVRQLVATSGGRDAALDALGLDRGIIRLAGELDDPYRARVRALPDTVSPNAINRVVSNLLQAVHGTYSFIETFQIGYQTAYDGPAQHIGASAYEPSLFCYDDPRPTTPFHNRWLDTNDYRGGFIIVVDNLEPLQDLGMAYDDTVPLRASDLISPTTGGARAPSVFDQTPSIPGGYLQGAYDGFDLQKRSLYRGLADILQGIKPAGACAAVELKGQ